MAMRAGGMFGAGMLEASLIRFAFKSRPNGIQLSSHTARAISTTNYRSAAPASSYVRKATPPPSPASTNLPSSPKSPSQATIDDQSPIKDMTNGLADEPLILDEGVRQVDWTRSFHGLSAEPFPQAAADILLAPLPFDDVEVKPDGIIYLPEIKYRRILNRAFGPGGWGLAPRGETIVTGKSVTREYALVAHGRYVSSLSLCILWSTCCLTCGPWTNTSISTDLFPLLVASKTTFLPKAFLPQLKAASPMRLCAAAKI
jgi:hypothetical protein